MKTASNSRVLRTIPLMLIVGLLCPFAYGKVIYVDDDTNGANDGSSWTNAYNYLQDALVDASSADKPVEIRVGQGTYKPNEGLVAIPEFNWRTATFQLINDISLMGGYAGVGAVDPDVRNVELYETILSGDLNGDDIEFTDPCNLLYEPTRGENSYHVVTGNGTDEKAVLDGFTITGGNADYNSPPDNCGGGIHNHSGSPTITNCTFISNSSVIGGGGIYNVGFSSPTLNDCIFSSNSVMGTGGGMYNCVWSTPILTNCTFSDNSSEYNGGGMTNDAESSPMLTNCTFRGNSAGYIGGGMCNKTLSFPILNNCTFIGNSAEYGGGMYNRSSSNPILSDCTFIGNWAEYGGGMSNDMSSNPTLTNCTFTDNSADFGGGIYNMRSYPTLTNCNLIGNSAEDGGGMYNTRLSSPILTNCIFSGNSAGYGGGMKNDFSSRPTLTNCTFARNAAQNGNALACDSQDQNKPSNLQITNCILWDGGNEIWNNDNSTIVITYSDIQGDFPGEGNINTDPLFANPNNDDYHLKSQAGRYDPNTQTWIQDDITSPCIDAGNPMSLIGHEPFPNGGIVNMGAYGGTAEASNSYFGEPVCETIIVGDINGDCKVDFLDFKIMGLHWLQDHNP